MSRGRQAPCGGRAASAAGARCDRTCDASLMVRALDLFEQEADAVIGSPRVGRAQMQGLDYEGRGQLRGRWAAAILRFPLTTVA